MTAWERRICTACRKPNHAHRDEDLNDAGECLRVAELPSRPAYMVVIAGDSDGVRAVKQAFAEMHAAELADGVDCAGNVVTERETARAMAGMVAAENEDGE